MTANAAAYGMGTHRDALLLPGPSSDLPRDAAMLRSYAVPRMVDGGASADTASLLHAWSAQGLDWIAGCRLCAGQAQQRAVEALGHDDQALASAWLVEAAACYRFAQAAQDTDNEEKLADYVRHSQLFATAMAHAPLRVQSLTLPAQVGAVAPWLFLPEASGRAGVPVPCVLVVGGADGWCEALYPTVPSLLARGLAVCLLELPGQGLTRLRAKRYLTSDFPAFVSAVLDVLVARGDIASAFGICGHSLGGSFAVAAAAADVRFAACCSNSGTARPAAGLRKFPRVLARVGNLLGGAPDAVWPFLDALDLPGCAERMQASLLCLHGQSDTLFDRAGVEELVHLRGTAHARLHGWPEGEHCLYSKGQARNAAVADWFAGALPPTAPSFNVSTTTTITKEPS